MGLVGQQMGLALILEGDTTQEGAQSHCLRVVPGACLLLLLQKLVGRSTQALLL